MAKKKGSSSSKHWRYRHWGAIKLLIVLGAIVTLILAIYYMISPTGLFISIGAIPALLWFVAWGIVHVLLSVVLLASTGVVNKPSLRVW